MNNIRLMNKIAKVGTDIFDKDRYSVSDSVEEYDAIMVRSAALHDTVFPASLKAIARCGAGVNNIPVEKCAEDGIVVFNTPGANANGVKELAICALILATRDVIGGVEWVKTLNGQNGIAKLVEAGKGAYVGHELIGKTLGVIGLGAIGGMVANAASALGMKVVGCDPFITPVAAWNLDPSVKQAASFEEIFKTCDYITLHVPATPQTKNMICEKSISMMKDGVRILNLARADLVNAADMKKALADKKVASYVTDFPTDETVGAEGIVNIPHLGASTFESEDNCAVMAAKQLDDYLTNGNIKNSVNFPNVSAPRNASARVCIMHKNSSDVLNQITSVFSSKSMNIENLANGSKGDYAYTIVDTNAKVDASVVNALTAVDGIIKVYCY